MIRKGITPVVAVVLLIAITVGAGTTVYSMVVQTSDVNQNAVDKLNLNPESLEFESCWGTSSNPNFSIRNTGQEAINASEIPVRVNASSLEQPNDYTIANDVVDPQSTFTLNIDTSYPPINEESKVGLILDGEIKTYQCRNLN